MDSNIIILQKKVKELEEKVQDIISKRQQEQDESDIPTLTVVDVSFMCKVSISTVYKWTHKKMIPYHKFSNQIRFKKREVEEFLQLHSILINPQNK